MAKLKKITVKILHKNSMGYTVLSKYGAQFISRKIWSSNPSDPQPLDVVTFLDRHGVNWEEPHAFQVHLRHHLRAGQTDEAWRLSLSEKPESSYEVLAGHILNHALHPERFKVSARTAMIWMTPFGARRAGLDPKDGTPLSKLENS